MRTLLRVALPVLLLGGVLLGGAVAGDLLRARTQLASGGTPAEGAADVPGEAARPSPADGSYREEGGDFAYLRFPQQFFVPIVRSGELRAVMVLALSLELPANAEEAVFRQEHRLRDALLRSLLIHANSGGFDGNFTAEAHLSLLRGTLLAEARRVAGQDIRAVLIGDIARQEQ